MRRWKIPRVGRGEDQQHNIILLYLRTVILLKRLNECQFFVASTEFNIESDHYSHTVIYTVRNDYSCSTNTERPFIIGLFVFRSRVGILYVHINGCEFVCVCGRGCACALVSAYVYSLFGLADFYKRHYLRARCAFVDVAN